MQPSSHRLRALRATPPGLIAGNPDRRPTFGAALQQFDDLLAGAAAIGPVSRPLPLYYAVHQAGKAIAAAWAPADTWHATGHGLAQDFQHPSSAWLTDVLRFSVKPKVDKWGPGVFGTVASVLGTARLTGSVELGALWSALPEVAMPPAARRWPLAMYVYPQVYEEGVRQFMSPAFRGFVDLRGQRSGLASATAVNDLLNSYPGSTGATAEISPNDGNLLFHMTPRGPAVSVRWPQPDVLAKFGEPIPGEVTAGHVTSRIPFYEHTNEHWLIPPVGDGSDQLPPLLLWWVLLFGLSLLARYEPAAWRAALDLDNSPCADPLTELLDQALQIVPYLLFKAATEDCAAFS